MMNRSKIDARSLAKQVVQRLTTAGHQAYWAGGCVRDLLLGQIPKDFDVATSARPEQVQKLFQRTIAVGASFGVITVIGGPGVTVEVATFRSDGKYSDGRRPDRVTYSSAEEDARRRDFTINGMFFDPSREEVLDYVGGKRDLEARVIRAIGDPTQRFQEDKLRLLRGVRFAARLGFVMEEATYQAIKREVATISVVSVERILAELRQMIEHVARVRGMELLRATGLFAHLYPELADDLDDASFHRSLAVLGWPNERVSLAWGMAALLTPIERGRAVALATGILERQRASNDDIDRAGWLVEHRDAWRDWESRKPHAFKRILARPGAEEWLELAHAMEHEETQSTDRSSRLSAQYREWGPAGVDPVPLVTGDDLIAWGYVPGREFKEILEGVRDRQLDGELSTPADAEAFVRTCWKRS